MIFLFLQRTAIVKPDGFLHPRNDFRAYRRPGWRGLHPEGIFAPFAALAVRAGRSAVPDKASAYGRSHIPDDAAILSFLRFRFARDFSPVVRHAGAHVLRVECQRKGIALLRLFYAHYSIDSAISHVRIAHIRRAQCADSAHSGFTRRYAQ